MRQNERGFVALQKRSQEQGGLMRHQDSKVNLVARLSESTEAVIRFPGFSILLPLRYNLLLIHTALLYISVHA